MTSLLYVTWFGHPHYLSRPSSPIINLDKTFTKETEVNNSLSLFDFSVTKINNSFTHITGITHIPTDYCTTIHTFKNILIHQSIKLTNSFNRSQELISYIQIDVSSKWLRSFPDKTNNQKPRHGKSVSNKSEPEGTS